MKGIVIIIIIIIIIFLGFLLLQRESGIVEEEVEREDPIEESPEEERFDKAPEFSLKNYNGETVSLSQFEDKIVVANAWATWCPFCVDELPDFVSLQETFPDEIVVIAIDRQESLSKAKSFTDSLGISDDLVYLLDPNDSFYRSIGGFSMPETIFIDKDKNIRIHKRGPMELDEMIERVNSILES